MKVSYIHVLCICLVAICLCTCTTSAKAAEFRGIEPIGIYELPSDFSILVNDTCSGHSFFYQVSARSDGEFLVCYRQANNTASASVFGTAYIDVFDSNGSFLYELSFETNADFVAEYTNETIYLYFYNYVISYDLISCEFIGYRIPDEAAIDSGVFEELRKSEFSSGQWHYKCTRAFHGYTKLIRTNETHTQELLSLPGSGYTIWNTIVPAIFLGTACIVLAVVAVKRIKVEKSSKTT